MADQALIISLGDSEASSHEPLLTREWLVTNGLGGYATGTISGAITRRYHGLLVASIPPPLGRMLMLSQVSEQLRLPNGEVIRLTGEEFAGGLEGAHFLSEFRLEMGLPIWLYKFDDFVLEKRIIMPHMQNTVHLSYRLVSGHGCVRLKLRPSMHFRSHDAPTNLPLTESYILTAVEDRLELKGPSQLPSLRMLVYGERRVFTVEGKTLRETRYRDEESRGYESTGDLSSAGYFAVDIAQGQNATLVASTESWHTIRDLSPEEALNAEKERRGRLLAIVPPGSQERMMGELVLAADQFIVTPRGRAEDVRVRAAGDEVCTVIAGYHWFTDWGRDTMISLEGLTLTTGRHIEAGYILRTFAHYVHDGLIPNMFPEGEKEGLYHTADATLWYFHALHRYVEITGDRGTLRLVLPRLQDIIGHHLRGTRFGIGVDSADGLLIQGAKGYQLTWMDAKVGDLVVTPRRGKAVEINALWYNALCLLDKWLREEGNEEAAIPFAEHAEKARESFNRRFWCAEQGYLYDVVDGEEGDDSACRPNQLFAISLTFPILDRSHWQPVVETVRERLLTPVGLRSLDPGHPSYKSKYFGNLLARDEAYHQGTVWAWLIGPFVDAWLKIYPDDRAGARQFLEGFNSHLNEACFGSISEVFDAEEPFRPRGCVAQAWSVAEVLRCWVGTADRQEHEKQLLVKNPGKNVDTDYSFASSENN